MAKIDFHRKFEEAKKDGRDYIELTKEEIKELKNIEVEPTDTISCELKKMSGIISMFNGFKIIEKNE